MVAEPMSRPAAGQLRDGWRMVEFGDVVRQVKADADRETSDLERYVAGEHMNTDDLRIRSWGSIGEGYLGPAFHRKFVKGQVLYGSRRTYLRKVAVADFDGICANTTFVLEPKGERLIPELLPFVMQTDAFNDHAVKQSRGSVNPYVNFRDIAWYTFPLPPKEEQRRIADILWAADSAVERWREVMARLNSDRVIYINALVPCPQPGEAVPLRAVCEMQNGKMFPSSDYRAEGIRLLRPGNLGEDGYFTWSDANTKRLPSPYATSAAPHLIHPGDLVMNLTAQSLEDGFMGRVCLAREGDEALLNQRIGRFFCKDWLLPDYLFRVMQTSTFRQVVESRCVGTKVRHLYWRHMEDFPLQIVDKNRQLTVIRAARELDQAAAAAKRTARRLSELGSGLRENLLQGSN